jgi:hypothetical protein
MLFLGGLISLVPAFFSKSNSIFMFGLGLILFAWFSMFFCMNVQGENYSFKVPVFIFSLLSGGGYLFALISRVNLLSRSVYWFGIFVLVMSAILLLLEVMGIYAQRVIKDLMTPGPSDEDFVFSGYENL